MFQKFMKQLKMQKQNEKPSAIILHTVKGKGCSFAENELYNHHMTVSKQQMEEALDVLLKELDRR